MEDAGSIIGTVSKLFISEISRGASLERLL